MRVFLERSGGFTGMRVSAEIDTDSLPPKDAERFLEMVRSAKLSAAESEEEEPTGMPDQFTYRITVVDGERTNAVSVSEGDVAPPLRPLVDFLVARARRGPGRGR